MSALPSTASSRPERSTLRGWKTTSPSERMTTVPLLDVFEASEGVRIEAIGEGIIDEEVGDDEQARVAGYSMR